MPKSIIISLDSNLEVYLIDTVNKTKLLYLELNKINSSLELYDNFFVIWPGLYKRIEISSDIYFITGVNAGFTDTRIISLWLRSLEVLDNKSNKIYQINDSNLAYKIRSENLVEIISILNNSTKYNKKKIAYSRSPTITKKPIT